MFKEISDLNNKYVSINAIEYKGTLSKEIHMDLIKCIVNGRFVRRSVKRELHKILK